MTPLGSLQGRGMSRHNDHQEQGWLHPVTGSDHQATPHGDRKRKQTPENIIIISSSTQDAEKFVEFSREFSYCGGWGSDSNGEEKLGWQTRLDGGRFPNMLAYFRSQ